MLIAVAEGATFIDEKGKPLNISKANTKKQGAKTIYGGVGQWLATWLNTHVPWDARSVNLGHLQRGGTPEAMDRVLAYALGDKAAQLIIDKDFNKVVVYKNGHTETVDFKDIEDQQKKLSDAFYRLVLNETKN